MTTTRVRTAAALSIAALTLVALTSCFPATPGTSASPSAEGSAASTPIPTPTPTPAVAAVDTTAPAPLLNLPCSSLATSSEVRQWQGSVTAVPTSALATGDLADAHNLLPVADYIRDSGGIDCVWSAGPVDHYTTNNAAVAPFLEVTVQFNAASAWASFASGFGISGNDGGECDQDSVGAECQTDHLVGGSTWIEVNSRKSQGPGPGDASKILETAVAAVKAAGTPAPLAAPETGTLAVGTKCTDFASTSAVQTALGTTKPITAAKYKTSSENYTDPNWFAGENILHNNPCLFESGAITEAQLAWMPGGSWAWTEAKALNLADAPLAALSLTGLGVNDSASIRCSTGDKSCFADLVLGGNWIEAKVGSTSSAANKRAAATALAQAIVTKLG